MTSPLLIEKVNTGLYRACRIPGIIITDKNTLLAYYECRRNGMADWGYIDIRIIRSDDMGCTWKEIITIDGEGDTLNNPVMISDGDTLHFLYMRNYRQLYHMTSTDDGITFSSPAEITSVMDEADYFWSVFACGPGHGIVHNGNIVVPLWVGFNHDDPSAHWPSFITTMYSSDHGKSWHLGEKIKADNLVNPSEHALASFNGNVISSVRSGSEESKRAVIVSPDGIRGWSAPSFNENLTDPCCMAGLCSENDILCSTNCDDRERRINLTLKISDDGFATLKKSIHISDKAGYSDIAVKDGRAYILYERACDADGIYFVSIDTVG